MTSDRPIKIPTFYRPTYCTDAAPLTSTSKQMGLMQMALAAELVDVITPMYDSQKVWQQIAQVHLPAYVEAIRYGVPLDVAQSQGFKWSPGFANSVMEIWAGHQFACLHAFRTEQMVFHPVSGAHHAHRTRGGGFCTFNFLVGGPKLLLDAKKIDLVAIIDLDAHLGDGTLSLVGTDDRYAIFGISEHGCQKVANPLHKCYAARNVAVYMQALATLPTWLDRIQPDLVEYNAGVDCHMNDHVGSIAGVTDAFLSFRDEFVLRSCRLRKIPVVVNLAGGYQDRGISERLHFGTLLQMISVTESEHFKQYQSLSD